LWLLVHHHEEKLSEDDIAYCEALISCKATIATAVSLGQRFLKLTRERVLASLGRWLADSEASEIKGQRNLAQSPRCDLGAA
jgi:hypothetical protein